MKVSRVVALASVVGLCACSKVRELDAAGGSGGGRTSNAPASSGQGVTVGTASSTTTTASTSATTSASATTDASVTSSSSGATTGGYALGPDEIIAFGLSSPTKMILVGTDVYVTEAGGQPSYSGSLARVPSTGGPVERVSPGEAEPFSLALVDDHVVWNTNADNADDGDPQLRRFSLLDGTVDTVLEGSRIWSLDADGDRILFSAGSLSAVRPGEAPVTLVSGEITEIVARGADVVYVDEDSLNLTASVRRRDASGILSTLYDGFAWPGRALARDGDDVYFVTGDGLLMRGSVTGTPAITLATGLGWSMSVMVDGGYAYAVSWSLSKIFRVPVAGGAVEEFPIPAGETPTVVVAGPDAIYWVCQDAGTVHRRVKL